MNDYTTSIAAITGRIATIQSRFGVRPPMTDPTPSASNTVSADPTGTGTGGSAFGALIDRLMAEPTSESPATAAPSITDLLAARLEQQTGLASGLPTAGRATLTRSPTITRVQSFDTPSTPEGVDGGTIVRLAAQYLGIPYVWGGEDPSGFDCSGLIQHVFNEVGIDLPRVARDQARVGTEVGSLAQAVPGDLVAFGDPVDHIGIYAGNGQMVVAPHTGDVVKVQDITRTPVTIRRILEPTVADLSSPGLAGTDIAVADSSDPAAGYRPLFRQAAERHGVPAELLEAVARQESQFHPNAVSPAGAQGLMQIMPATARALGVDPFDPIQAVDGSARLLSQHLRRFGSVPLALAAYNAGPGAVERFGGVPPYRETQGYVSKIMADLADGGSNRPVAMFAQPAPVAAANPAPVAAVNPAPSPLAVSPLSSASTAARSAPSVFAGSRPPTAPLLNAAINRLTSTTPTTTTTPATTTAPVTTTATAAAAVSAPVAVAKPKAPDIVWPTGPAVSPASGAWGPNTQMQVTSVGGENTVSWGAAGLLAAASPEEIQAVVPGATGPVAKGVLKSLQNATAIQMQSKEFRQTLNDVNRDALGLPNAPDVIPVEPPAPSAAVPSTPAPAPAATPTSGRPTPLTTGSTTASSTAPLATVLTGAAAVPPSSRGFTTTDPSGRATSLPTTNPTTTV